MTRARNENSDISLFLPESWRVELCGLLSLRQTALVILVLIAIVLFCPSQAAAQPQSLTITQAAGGIPWAGSNPAASQFGTMNAMGVGATATGVTVIPLTNGALYYTPYQLNGAYNGNHAIRVTAVIKTNFVHPAALVLESCPSNLSCNTSGAFSAMSTTTPVVVVSTPSGHGPITATAGLAVFLPDNNGASAFTGADTASITLTMIDENNNKIATAEIDLNSPSGETVQTAVRMTLGTATGGLTISPSADYAANFGSVNGLGIGPGTGLTTVSVAGGTIYSTPYLINPAFGDFGSTTATIKVALTTNFVHPAALQLDDSSSSSGPYTQITSTPLSISTTAADRTAITRFLGLFVASGNGAGMFAGNDSATLTFTMTVP